MGILICKWLNYHEGWSNTNYVPGNERTTIMYLARVNWVARRHLLVVMVWRWQWWWWWWWRLSRPDALGLGLLATWVVIEIVQHNYNTTWLINSSRNGYWCFLCSSTSSSSSPRVLIVSVLYRMCSRVVTLVTVGSTTSLGVEYLLERSRKSALD